MPGRTSKVLSLNLVVLTFVGAVSAGCNGGTTREATSAVALPEDVRRELDSIQGIAKATQDEYERLYSTVVFPDDEKKRAAAKWNKDQQVAWSMIQLNDIQVRKQGRFASPFELLMMIGGLDSFIDAEPSVFVETTYYPKLVKKELVSLAKLATLREDYEAAKLRLLKSWLAVEQAAVIKAK